MSLVGGESDSVTETQWNRANRCVAAMAGINWQSQNKGQAPRCGRSSRASVYMGWGTSCLLLSELA